MPNLLRMPRTDDGGLSSESPNLLPVYWLRSRGRLIRALSLLIRDDAGEVVGVLCINQDVTNVSAAAGQLQALLALLPPGEASILPEASASADALASEHAAAQLASAVSRNTEAKDLQKDSDIELEGSVLKTVYAMIDRMTERVRAGRSSSAVLPREERLPLVRFMDTRGVFLVKGARLCRRAFRGLKGDALQRFGSPQARIGISRLFGLRTAEKVKNTPKL